MAASVEVEEEEALVAKEASFSIGRFTGDAADSPLAGGWNGIKQTSIELQLNLPSFCLLKLLLLFLHSGSSYDL